MSASLISSDATIVDVFVINLWNGLWHIHWLDECTVYSGSTAVITANGPGITFDGFESRQDAIDYAVGNKNYLRKWR